MPIYHWTVPFFFFFFNDTATTEIYTLSLHDALPISPVPPEGFYPGEYLKDTARKLFERDGEKWFDKRSEEHTSELQSLAYLVCRLLLEKKKTAMMIAHQRASAETVVIGRAGPLLRPT